VIDNRKSLHKHNSNSVSNKSLEKLSIDKLEQSDNNYENINKMKNSNVESKQKSNVEITLTENVSQTIKFKTKVFGVKQHNNPFDIAMQDHAVLTELCRAVLDPY